VKPLRRRELLLGLGASALGVMALTACDAVPGLAPRKQPLIGFLSNVEASDLDDTVQGFREGLREHRLVEGDTVRIEWRFADGNNDLLPGLVAELLGLGVQVIAATGGTAPRYARQATDRVPIVQLGGGGPAIGVLAASLSRPGGNVTGVGFPDELASKALETLSEVLPSGPTARGRGQPVGHLEFARGTYGGRGAAEARRPDAGHSSPERPRASVRTRGGLGR
jgi:putative ABC transport system substrate-binding protein